MRIEHILDSDAKAKLGVLSQGKGKVHPEKKNVSRAKYERLSEQDIKELMGVNRQTYRRVNGKIRRK
ncbi:hypothetical protein H9636_16050 [Ureibacillus sp. Re31]|uniref:Uncharacterized protein n=1 Tax=Ureibacillus galli TaxID=2762222 RepID=A0ABR8XG30_9BACL|nr:hypothetical protein [Ureibacillus galli]MBD8028161.1 hypothetical protein [Ureibacillus galli]